MERIQEIESEVNSLGRTLYRIWFLGAAVWFFDAVLSMHRHALGFGLAQAGIAAGFLLFGMMFKREYLRRLRKRGEERNDGQEKTGDR
jgi:hypothetical protein